MNSQFGWHLLKICVATKEVYGITSDYDGNIYFTTNSNCIYKLSCDNIFEEPTEITTRDYNWFRGIVCDENFIFICDAAHDNILQYDVNTEAFSILAGKGKSGHSDGRVDEAMFFSPWGITIDKNGDLYVTEKHRIRKIHRKLGIVSTVAGSSHGYGTGGFRDGLQAQFNLPMSVCVNDEGTLFVADYQNNCIRQIKDNYVSTITGNPLIEDRSVDGPCNQALFDAPCCINITSKGNLLVCDTVNAIRKIDMHRKKVTSATLPAQGPMRSCLCFSPFGFMIIARGKTIYMVETPWKVIRLLWIGKLKEDSRVCHLAKLPRDVILEIAHYLY